jgi:hypothetical protein
MCCCRCRCFCNLALYQLLHQATCETAAAVAGPCLVLLLLLTAVTHSFLQLLMAAP